MKYAQSCRQHLETILSMESVSDESNPKLPSSHGQQVLSEHLATFFEKLGYAVSREACACLIVTIPASPGYETAPALALMSHIDTAAGSRPLMRMRDVPQWQGEPLLYPENPELVVSEAAFPVLAAFKGQHILYGNGLAPAGLDDKLGVAQLMKLAEVLALESERIHGPLYIALHTDEEISRHEPMQVLSARLRELGVRYGYALDGTEPFEINVENFDASRTRVFFQAETHTLAAPEAFQVLSYQICGVATHGESAKREGHRSFMRIVTDFLKECTHAEILFLDVDKQNDVLGTITLALPRSSNAESIKEKLASLVEPHRSKGAFLRCTSETQQLIESIPLQYKSLLSFLAVWEKQAKSLPLYPEDSEGRQGYSNPYAAYASEEGITLLTRQRDFSQAELRKREQEIDFCLPIGKATCIHEQQYSNLGPQMSRFSEIIDWPKQAAQKLGYQPQELPIRGGLGMEPFVSFMAIANLGLGYFGMESPKELTSLEMIEAHTHWYLQIFEEVATSSKR